MSRITKEIASQVAKDLTSKKLKEVTDLNNLLSKTLEQFILKRIPKEVKDCFEKHKGYLQKRKGFQLSGFGFDYNYIYTINEIPYNTQSFLPTEDEAKILLSIKDKKEKLKKDYYDLLLEIEVLLYGLRTYSKVISEFPEAEPFLPNSISNKLMVNVSEIRNKLK